MTSQREIWDQRYRDRNVASFSSRPPSDFAVHVAFLLPATGAVLELGCGAGWDAAYFASLGQRVHACDFADSLIAQNRERFAGNDALTFAVHDIAEPLPVSDASHDLVYARLSLHYFDDATTRRIFDDVARVLRPGGLLGFMCKSTDDPLYGQGDPAGPDMFYLHHLRHFFSEAYTRDVLAARFDVVSLVIRTGDLYGEPSAWIEAVARKR